MVNSVFCYHPDHAEHAGNPAAWNQENVDKKALIKPFELDNGALIACADEKGLSGTVTVRWERTTNVRAGILTEADPEPKRWEITMAGGKITAELPDTGLAILTLEDA